jgi:hypothetical protein
MNNINLNTTSDKGIKRQKRQSNQHRQSIIINEDSKNNIFKESNNITKMNNKECQKKVAKKNKKKLSEKDNSPKSNKQKKNRNK